MISDVVRPAFEDVFSRKESFTEAFNVTGLYPFNPQAPDRSKLHPGDQYQPSEDSPGDIRDVEDDVTAAQLRTLSSITPLFRPHLCSRFGRPLLSSIVADLQVVNGVLQAKVPCNLLKKTTERNVRKPDQNNYTNVKRKSSDQSQGQGLRKSKRRK